MALVADCQVEPTITIEVSGCHPTRAGNRLIANLGPECAVAFADEQGKSGLTEVGSNQVNLAVSIEIRGGHGDTRSSNFVTTAKVKSPVTIPRQNRDRTKKANHSKIELSVSTKVAGNEIDVLVNGSQIDGLWLECAVPVADQY